MKPDIKEIIRNEYVHGYINDKGQRVMPTLDDLINKYNAASSALKAQKLFKNVAPLSTSAPVNTESFQRAMELLDEVADLKRKS